MKRQEVDTNKISFIVCVNDLYFFEECINYLHRLKVPKDMTVEILEIRDAVSMTSGYNEGMESSNAKYKVYMHQDVFLINPNFIYDIINIFQTYRDVGMIGLIGSRELPANGIMWHGQRVPFRTVPPTYRNMEKYCYRLEDGCYEVLGVDGLLIATQYDVAWREDIFDGWHFYDLSQSYEMRKRGYKVVVPNSKVKWYIHDDKVLSYSNYDKYRKIFIKEYIQSPQFID